MVKFNLFFKFGKRENLKKMKKKKGLIFKFNEERWVEREGGKGMINPRTYYTKFTTSKELSTLLKEHFKSNNLI